MCHCQPWEGSPPQSEYSPQRTGNGVEHLQVRWETGLAKLEEQITSIEARVEKLKASVLQLRREMLIVCVLFLVTVVYAICAHKCYYVSDD